jgi:hypothetical protein
VWIEETTPSAVDREEENNIEISLLGVIVANEATTRRMKRLQEYYKFNSNK